MRKGDARERSVIGKTRTKRRQAANGNGVASTIVRLRITQRRNPGQVGGGAFRSSQYSKFVATVWVVSQMWFTWRSS